MERNLCTDDHEGYQEVVREFVAREAREVEPHPDKWDRERARTTHRHVPHDWKV